MKLKDLLKNKKTIIIISSIAILSLIIAITLILTNDNPNLSIGHNNGKPKDWMEYILSTNIKSINLNYCIEDNPNAENGYQPKTIQIKKEELELIFNEMKKGELTKVYYGGMYHPCSSGIEINYTNSDNKDYKLYLYMNKYINVEEAESKKILGYLEKTKHLTEKWMDDMDIETTPYMFEYSYNESIIENLITQYTEEKK